MTGTPLDLAHAAMQANDGDAPRMRFYDRLAASELFLLLDAEADGDTIVPRLFEVEDQSLALVFDTEERLTDLSGPSPFAALSGRQLASLLDGQGIGIGLNLGVAPSAFVMDPTAVTWLADTVQPTPERVEAMPENLHAPGGLPERFLESLDARLAASAGLASTAYLSGITYKDRTTGHLLAFIDPVPGAQEALARTVAEALNFSGIEAGALDVAFFEASDPVSATLSRCGLRFDLPKPRDTETRPIPGGDPDRPPRLK